MRIINTDPKRVIISAVNKYLSYIAPTYGPAGKEILIADDFSVKAVDDGKIASQEFELENEFENSVVKYIKEVTEKTENRVGDGTTTSGILMGSIVTQLLKEEDPNSLETKKVNLKEETKKIKKGLMEAIAHIKKISKKIKTKQELYKVAYNSYNNEEIAKLISDTIYEIGPDGVLTIEDSKTMQTTCDMVEGLEVSKGFVSPYLMNKNGEVYLENPAILLTNAKLESSQEVMPLIKGLVENGIKKIVIVADDFSDDVMGFFIVNKLKDIINPLLIKTPGYGDSKLENLKDIAVITGAKLIDEKTGTSLKDANPSFLGSAELVKSTQNSTIFVKGQGTKKAVLARIEEVKSKLGTNSLMEEENNKKRIAQLEGKIAVIRVGASTENEQKSIKVKVEDAINASKVALKDGIVEGGGKTFASIETSSEVLNEALKAPRKQLEDNGKDSLDDNVFDPALVLIASLETAVSIATGLVNLGGISAIKREKKEPNFGEY